MRHTALLVWEHGGNLGHLARLIPVALALRARDIDVRFAVRDLQSASAFLSPIGFSCTALPASVHAEAAGPVLNHSDLLLRSGFGAPLASVTAAIDAWQRMFDSSGADAVLADASPLALYAAAAGEVPVFAFGHGFEIPPAQSPGPCFAPWVEGAIDRCAQLELRLQRRLHELAAATGGPAAIAGLFPASRSLLCIWPELDHFDRRAKPTPPVPLGPIWHEFSETPAVFAQRDGPRVLCYLNIVDKQHDLLWQALGKGGANVLVLSPHGNSPAAQAARGWGIDVIEHEVALREPLGAADAVIGHGGMGFSSMALQAGKPLLLLPQNVEQAILSHRLLKQGLADATLRARDKAKLQLLVDRLLARETDRPELSAFSGRHRSYSPAIAADAIAARLASSF